MVDYVFEFDLEKGEISEDTFGKYAVRYYNTVNGKKVELGDGYRHEIYLEAKYWNKILRIIRDDELDKEGIRAITKGLMYEGLPEEYERTLIDAIKSRVVKEF